MTCDAPMTFEVHSVRGARLSEAARETLRQAFSCDLPAGHDGDHQAHDAEGILLAWWEQQS